MLQGRIIPAQSDNPLPPQRRPGESGHLPGAYSGRRPSPAQPPAALDQLASRIQQGGPDQGTPQGVQTGRQATLGQQGAQDEPPHTQPPGSESTPLSRWDPPRPEQQLPNRRTAAGSLTPHEDRHLDEPDWAALAEANDSRSRRRRILVIGGGMLAAAAITVGTVAVANTDDSRGSRAADGAEKNSSSPPEPKFPEITPPPPPNPLVIISSAEKDTAPLTTDTIFPRERFILGDRAYDEGPTDSTKDCASVGLDGLGPILTGNGCRRMLRATYIRDGVSVTVGIAVFDTKKAASKVKTQAVGHISPLTGGNVGRFCQPAACWSSTNAIGRYAYFTMAGLSNNLPVASTDTRAKQCGRDVATFAFRQILQRGKDAAGQ